MKKEYICPASLLVRIHNERPIAGSQDVTSTGYASGITFGGTASAQDNINPEVKANPYNVWDDDWSE